MSGYELVDAGEGRRLERFGSLTVDRPAPGCTSARQAPGAWVHADGRFDRATGWQWPAGPPSDWWIRLEDLELELRPTDAGQVGVFPEHADHWPWLADRAAGRDVLHLFAYTGATTLRLVRAGGRVVHLDASKPAVTWARRNAIRNRLDVAPIRWIVDDVPTFVARELRRGRRYGGIILDPPTYGHGRGGRSWRIEADLPELLSACVGLLDDQAFVLLTGHTVDLDPGDLAALLERAIDDRQLPDGAGRARVEAGPMVVTARSGVRLSLGAFARWPGS